MPRQINPLSIGIHVKVSQNRVSPRPSTHAPQTTSTINAETLNTVPIPRPGLAVGQLDDPTLTRIKVKMWQLDSNQMLCILSKLMLFRFVVGITQFKRVRRQLMFYLPKSGVNFRVKTFCALGSRVFVMSNHDQFSNLQLSPKRANLIGMELLLFLKAFSRGSNTRVTRPQIF
jgi:hypothetical protein